jgi:hypothetical protein
MESDAGDAGIPDGAGRPFRLRGWGRRWWRDDHPGHHSRYLYVYCDGLGSSEQLHHAGNPDLYGHCELTQVRFNRKALPSGGAFLFCAVKFFFDADPGAFPGLKALLLAGRGLRGLKAAAPSRLAAADA